MREINQFNNLKQKFVNGDLWKDSQKVLVIGGGTSGIAVAISLLKKGITPIIVEQSESCGGIWSKDKHIAAYPWLVQNTAPKLTLLDGEQTDRKSHYLKDEYAEITEQLFYKYELDKLTFFNTRVAACNRSENNFNVKLESTACEGEQISLSFDHAIYAGGLYHVPYIPNIKGLENYTGQVYHSSELDSFSRLTNKRVLVVGLGNTGGDYVSEICKIAKLTAISVRGDTWIVPKTRDGLPIDEYVQCVKQDCKNYSEILAANFSESEVVKIGAMESLDFTKSRITVNTEFIELYHNNVLDVYGEIQSVNGLQVVFNNEIMNEYDAIVFCTGFTTDLPDFGICNFSNPLIANVASPDIENLWLVGSPAVWGGSPPIAEAQAQLIAFSIKHCIGPDKLKTFINDAPSYEQTNASVSLGFKVVEFQGYSNFVAHICATQPHGDKLNG